MNNTQIDNYGDEVDLFGSEENFSTALGMLFEFGDTHEEMHECFKETVKFVMESRPLSPEDNKDTIKDVVFGLLEWVVNERVSDMLLHRWDYKECTTAQFVRMLNEPLEALACTYRCFIGDPDDDTPVGASIH